MFFSSPIVTTNKLTRALNGFVNKFTGDPSETGVFGDTLSEQLKRVGLAVKAGAVLSDDKAYITAKNLTTLTVKAGVVFAIGDTIVQTAGKDIAVAGAAVGEDWKVYAFVDTNGALAYQLSKTALAGSYILLGGFHYGRVRNSTTATDVSEGIVPNSVWTTLHRPICDPSGMVYCGNGLWADIYIMSGDPIVSKYNAAPHASVTWYDTWNLLRAVGKRMPSYGEWCTISEGSPEGQDGNNTYARTATSNNDAGKTGDVKLAVSSLNAVDCVGRVWEWVDELCLDPTASSWTWQDIAANAGHGDMYSPSASALHTLVCGGFWGDGVHCGSRTVFARHCPWDSNPSLCGRGVCDSL